QAAIEAGRQRLRPILMTSLTTILGMLPIALGLGEGGKILQPLGITVSGGLWVSTLLTLFIVPALQAGYLEWRTRKTQATSPSWAPALMILLFLLPASHVGAAQNSPPSDFIQKIESLLSISPTLQRQENLREASWYDRWSDRLI